ncbi:hypothetical protein [Polynucleobacter sp. MWH-Svant-W18]|uniref:hypothetical protein n=1 Tax=Polynucleobacter sp. MWH-Svant-W18 TaxID=1855909 RepID=UPI00204210B5|nr:hypothetical protein [Polynucleobacter sp. MWH-Svant-W18]
MTAHPTSSQSQLRRFTLLLSGEDAYDMDEGSKLVDRPTIGLPHERFLLGNLAPIAPVLLLGQSTEAMNPEEVIACLQPVHLHATRDHLILMGQNQIDLTATESAELLKVALPFIEEDFQSPVLFKGERYWFIPAGPFASLASYSVDQAHGRNIDWWMPRDTNETGIAKRWRKLQNEIQMLWHIGSVNEEREQRGMPSINSLWISGIGKLNDVQIPEVIKQSRHLYGPHPLLAGLAKLLSLPYSNQLSGHEMAGAFAWLEHPATIWPTLSAALLNKELDEVLLIDFPNGKVRQRCFTIKDLNKKSWAFWKKAEPLTWQEIISS